MNQKYVNNNNIILTIKTGLILLWIYNTKLNKLINIPEIKRNQQILFNTN